MSNTILWSPKPSKQTKIDEFRAKINLKYNQQFENYFQLHKWSIENYDLFWEEVWNFTGIKSSHGYTEIVNKNQKINEIPEWFQGCRLNFAENVLRHQSDRVAIYVAREGRGCIDKRTFSELRDRVAQFIWAMKNLGVDKDDVVAGILSNSCEAVEAMLATASIGAIWTSVSVEFGVKGILDRLLQVKPKILFTCDNVVYNGKRFSQLEKLSQIVPSLPGLVAVVIIDYSPDEISIENGEFKDDWPNIPKSIHINKFLQLGKCNGNINFAQLPFNHPLFILYSSGTTGTPKCMVHSAGGTLIKHLEEHEIEGNMGTNDIILYFTTTGWMMWNWLVTCLASGTSIVLYDGSPLYPNPEVLWDLIEELKVTIVGTGAKWLAILEDKNIFPNKTHQLKHLHTIYSTGSPLSPHSFDYVYNHIKSDVLLASITGGTDIIGCFAGINTSLPVHRGEIQSAHLGMAVESWSEDGKQVYDVSGELVCVKPFPSMPIKFWNDRDSSKYQNAYFRKFPGVWCHGDYCKINSKTGGIKMLGRSDGTLNPNGIRFGSADIYNVVERITGIQDSLCVSQLNSEGDERVVLFVKLSPEDNFTPELVNKIKEIIRRELSPRHVPAVILETRDIPYTTNGKKVEIAVKKIISGKEDFDRSSLANPSSLELYQNIKELTEWK